MDHMSYSKYINYENKVIWKCYYRSQQNFKELINESVNEIKAFKSLMHVLYKILLTFWCLKNNYQEWVIISL
jgi:hypothetical protein